MHRNKAIIRCELSLDIIWSTFHILFLLSSAINVGLPWGLSGKESTLKTGDSGDEGSIPRSGSSPGEGHGNPLQYSCLKNPMDRGGWQATVHRLAESDMTEVT